MTGFAFVMQEGDIYVAKSYEGLASQGKTPDEAIENLKEALDLYYEDEPLTNNTCFVASFSRIPSSRTYDKITV